MAVVIGASQGAIGHTCCHQGNGVVHVRMRWGLGPLRPGEPSQAPLWEARGTVEPRKGPQTKSPQSSVPTGQGAGSRQVQGAAKWESALSRRASVCCGRAGQELRPEGSWPPPGRAGAYSVVCCVVCGGEGAGRGAGLGEGGGSGSRAKPSSPRGKLLLGCRSRRHGAVTAPPRRTPARCPPLPPSPVFWVCPLASFLELWWFSGSWQHPCSCSPLVGPEVSWVLALR